MKQNPQEVLFALQRLGANEAWHAFIEETKNELKAVEDLMTTVTDPNQLFRLSGEARVLRGVARWLESNLEQVNQTLSTVEET